MKAPGAKCYAGGFLVPRSMLSGSFSLRCFFNVFELVLDRCFSTAVSSFSIRCFLER